MSSALLELQQGQSLQKAGKLAEARLRYEQALRLDPTNAPGWFLLGTLAMAERQPARAAWNFRKTVELQPDHLEAWCSLALAQQAQGRLGEAIAAYRQALALKPDFPELLCNLGNALHGTGDLPAAVVAYRAALRLKPDFPEVHNSLGVAHKAEGRLDEAIAAYRAALTHRSDYLPAHGNLALALRAQGKRDEAIAACRQALALDPHHVPALLTLGGAQEEQGRLDEAAVAYQRILERTPHHAGAHCNLGVVRQAQDRLDEAIAAYRRALATEPDQVEALTNLGTALQAQNDLPAAIAAYRQAIARRPDLAQAHFNEGVCLLAAGDFPAGWPKYEYRWQCEQGKFQRSFPAPLWRGETSLADKTILIYPEQGLGDTLQFVRYIPQLAAMGAKVVLEVQPPLRSLFDAFPGTSAVVARGQPLPPFDVHCPLLSLPLALGTTAENIPTDAPYLRAPSGKLAHWAAILRSRREPRIGLVWSGGPHHKTDRLRSIPLEQFRKLVNGMQARFYALQKEIKESDATALGATPEIVPLAGEIRDFSDTAAIVANLDLVISVDTSVAHLAGALGKPTWILLPFAPDWRWMLERTDSPWYPTVKLFRQPAPGAWPVVLEKVRVELARFIGDRAPLPGPPSA